MSFKRTNLERPSTVSEIAFKAAASWTEFLAENRLMVLFTLLFLAGTIIGLVVFAVSGPAIKRELGTLLELRAVMGGFKGVVSMLFSSCFSAILLLALLFLCGLSACGAPFAVIVPLFYGMGLGMTEAFYCATGIKGFVTSSLLIIPHYIIAATALVLGSMESIRMSLLFSRQILPNCGIGGLWHDFKLFCVRFLTFICLAFASGIVDICLRLMLGPLLL